MAQESDSSLKLYLREISKTPLLSAEEEIALAERIKKGDAEARSHMIRANLRLVVKIAQDYSNYGMPVMDLISEGNIGLMKAVSRFDPEKVGNFRPTRLGGSSNRSNVLWPTSQRRFAFPSIWSIKLRRCAELRRF